MLAFSRHSTNSQDGIDREKLNQVENFIKMFANQDGTDHEKLDKVDSTKIEIFTNEDGKDRTVSKILNIWLYED